MKGRKRAMAVDVKAQAMQLTLGAQSPRLCKFCPLTLISPKQSREYLRSDLQRALGILGLVPCTRQLAAISPIRRAAQRSHEKTEQGLSGRGSIRRQPGPASERLSPETLADSISTPSLTALTLLYCNTCSQPPPPLQQRATMAREISQTGEGHWRYEGVASLRIGKITSIAR